VYRSSGAKRETPPHIDAPPTQPESLVNNMKWLARWSPFLANFPDTMKERDLQEKYAWEPSETQVRVPARNRRSQRENAGH
jgi:hypothetical protein